MRGKLILSALVPATLILFAVAHADPGRRGGPEGAVDVKPVMEKLAKRLELTEDQVKKIEEIHEQKTEKRGELRKDLMRLRNELEGVMMEDEPSAARARELVQKIGAVHTSMQLDNLETRFAMRGVLTQEQRDKLMGGFPGMGGPGFFGCRFDGGDGPGHGWGHHGRGDWCDGGGRHGGGRGWSNGGPGWGDRW